MRTLSLVFLVSACIVFTGAQKRAVVRPPVISPPGGTYALNENVSIVIRAEPGSRIIYSFTHAFPDYGNGTEVNSNVVVIPLPPGDSRLRAVAVRPSLSPSQPTEAKYVRIGNK